MKIKIALQKSGKLHNQSVSMLQECGIEFSNGFNKLKSEAYNFPMEILFLRDDDIPEYVEDGVADIGIVGEDIIVEKGSKIRILEKLNFGHCRLSLAVPKDFNFTNLGDLKNLRIATSYTRILKKFLNKNKIKATIHEIKGSVEIATSIGLADAVFDIVSSGNTLFLNGLKEVNVVMNSEAVLVSGRKFSKDKQLLIDDFVFRMKSLKNAKNTKYIMLNIKNTKIDNIIELLPGIKSPTIIPLAKPGWSSIHSVVYENDFWKIIHLLKNLGAEGILVLSIEKKIL
jgi:ATP phosphoribosyltransferase